MRFFYDVSLFYTADSGKNVRDFKSWPYDFQRNHFLHNVFALHVGAKKIAPSLSFQRASQTLYGYSFIYKFLLDSFSILSRFLQYVHVVRT